MNKQAVMTKPGEIEFREVEIPVIGPEDVLIQVKRIGVCGSDIHVWHGLHPYTSYPVVQGHEVSGVIVQAGEAVKDQFTVGSKAVFMPQVTCEACYSCRHGMDHICDDLKVMGFQTSGAAQEFFSVPASKVLVLPEVISLDQAAMIEPISVAVHAVARAGGVEGKKVVVLGAGNIGNLVGQVALASGAQELLITDISEYKLDKARQCGLKNAVNSSKVDLQDAIRNVMGPDKADVIFECVGHSTTIHQAVQSARKGSTIVVVGVFSAPPRVDIGLVQDRELSIVGSLMYQKPDYERAIELVASDRLALLDLITHRFPFDQYREAYQMIDSLEGKNMKVMIEM